jgi:hypothetical protein
VHARAVGLFLFWVLLLGAALLPSQVNWVHVWGGWPWSAVALGGFLAPLVVLAHGRLSKVWDWTVWTAVLALAAGLWTTPWLAPALPTFVQLGLLLLVGFGCGRVVSGDRSLWPWLALALTVVGTAVALVGLVEVTVGRNPLYEWSENPFYAVFGPQRRAMSTQFNPAPLGSFLALVVPFAAWLGWGERSAWRSPARLALLILLAGTIVTYSRGALLALVFSAAVGLVLVGRRRQVLALVVAVVVLVATASLLPYPLDKFGVRGFLSHGGFTSVKRLSRVEMTAAMLHDRPLVGLGLHGFRAHFHDYYPSARAPAGKAGGVADNSYLTILGETGLLGAGGLALFLGVQLARGIRAWRRRRGGLLVPALASSAGLVVSAAGYDLVYWSGPTLLGLLVLGLVAGAARAGSEVEEPAQEDPKVPGVEHHQGGTAAVVGAQPGG